MNTWQVMKQVSFTLDARRWGSSLLRLFHQNSIQITAGDDVARKLGLVSFPMALIVPRSSQADPRFDAEPGLERQEFEVIVGQMAFDTAGDKVLMRANPPDALNGSAGRGLMELRGEVSDTLKYLGRDNGMDIQSRGMGAAQVVRRDDQYIAAVSLRFAAWVTTVKAYPPVEIFRVTDDGGGDALIEWKNPGDRFDRLKLTLRRASGSTPPATPTAGDAVTVPAFPESLVDSVGAGTFSYSMFVWYDDENAVPVDEKKVSPARTVSGVVVL